MNFRFFSLKRLASAFTIHYFGLQYYKAYSKAMKFARLTATCKENGWNSTVISADGHVGSVLSTGLHHNRH